MIKAQVSTYTDTPSGAKSRHLAESETVGFISLRSKFAEPATKDQNYASPLENIGVNSVLLPPR